MEKSKTIGKEIFIIIMTTMCITLMIMSNNNKVYTEMKSNKVDGFVMKSDGVDIGIVRNEEIGNEAIDIVKERYLSKANLTEVKLVIVDNKITYEKVSCNEREIYTPQALSNKIIDYNNNNKKSIITFTVVKENQAISVMSSMNKKLVALNNSLHTPTIGWLTSYFGTRNGVMHKGIDVAADLGSPIEAALDGKVSFSGVANGYGKVIKIDHGSGMETVYAHCNKLYVSSGETVKKGQHIADVGSTGDSTGPHLHFELKINGTAVDPLKYGNGS